MASDEQEFAERVGAVLRRFYAQNEQTPPAAATLDAFGARLWALVCERGLPRPLAPHERGEPGGMTEAQCEPLVARVLGDSGDALLAEAARQLVKTCFYPEFRTCRDSFRAVAPDGACRRQELARVRRRVSGAHCVDCPHWIALPPDLHLRYLGEHWQAGPEALAKDRAVFLPEDFRALRHWLHAAARRDAASPDRAS